MSGNLIIWSKQNGRDTSYRTSNLDTHLTHGCIQLFCGSEEMLIASPQGKDCEKGGISGFFAMADSISPGVAE